MQSQRYLRNTLAMTALAAVMASSAHAVVVYSGPVNIAIPATLDGLYLNMVTGATSTSLPGPAGWDINPYSAAAGQFNLWGATTTTWFNSAATLTNAAGYVLAPGTTIGGATSNFFRPGGGTDIGPAVTLNGANLFGVRFTNEAGNTIHHGWVQITFGANAATRAITGYAFESTPNASIMAGVVPEPGTYALMLAGLAGVAGIAARRRKTAAA